MKTPFFITLLLTIVLSAHSQDKRPDSIRKNTSQQANIRTCYSSIADASPLYIVDGVPLDGSYSNSERNDVAVDDIVSIRLLKGIEAAALYGVAGSNGVVLIQTKRSLRSMNLPKTYTFPLAYKQPRKRRWTSQRDLLNDLKANTPSMAIEEKGNGTFSKMKLRSASVKKVIMDGVQYDISILEHLSPDLVETIKVVPSIAEANYLLNH